MLYKYLLPAVGKNFPPEPCENCPLGKSRKVGARGNPESPLVIIGEGPGTEEIRYGTPFCGPSGDLLNTSVPGDFDFDDAYIINAMQCRIKTGKPAKDKELKARGCAACRNRTLNQIFQYPRKAILALGAWANSSLTADYDFKITQKRGIIYSINDPITGEEIPVIAAFHPAFLLRGKGNIKTFREDIAEAFAIAYPQYYSLRHHSNWEDPAFTILDTVDAINKYHATLEWAVAHVQVEEFKIASDIETSGFNPITDRILCIGFYLPSLMDIVSGHPNFVDTAAIIPDYALKDSEIHKATSRLLSNEMFRFVWQFGKFDEKFLYQNNLIDRDLAIVHEDTGLISYTLSEATKDHDLDEQAKNTLGAPDHKHVLKQWVPKKTDSYEKVPSPVLWDYLAKDLKKTYMLWEHNRPLVAADPALEKLYVHTLIPASHLLAEIEAYGIHVDWDYVRINREGATQEDVEQGLVESVEKEKGLEWELIDIENRLQIIAGYSVNPNSPPEVASLLYDRFGLRIKGRRPTDTTKETLEKLPKHPAVELVRKYRSTTKMLSTYVKAIEEQAIDDRIHTTFKLHITPTGRLSSTEPNLQNIPRMARYRRMYCAKPGFKLMEGDYNSAELRMLAVLSGDDFLTGVFLDDKRNLHDEVSIEMYGANFTGDQRIRAKAINFGIPYGREAFSIAEEFDITTKEAQRLIDVWFARAPKAKAFLDRSRSAPRLGKTLVTVFGRKRRPGVVSHERLHGLMNEFANFHMQSPISDFTVHSAIEMLPRLKKEGAHIVNLIHDSAVAEFPADSIEREQQVAGIIKETMEHVPTKWITTPIRFKVDLKCGTHWGLAEKYEIRV